MQPTAGRCRGKYEVKIMNYEVRIDRDIASRGLSLSR